MSSSDNLDHVFKILLIGDAGVGKSSILLQFTDSYFNDNLQSTIGVDFKVKVMDAAGIILYLFIIICVYCY